MCTLDVSLPSSRHCNGRIESCLDSRASLSCGGARRSCADDDDTRHHSPMFAGLASMQRMRAAGHRPDSRCLCPKHLPGHTPIKHALHQIAIKEISPCLAIPL